MQGETPLDKDPRIKCEDDDVGKGRELLFNKKTAPPEGDAVINVFVGLDADDHLLGSYSRAFSFL